MKIKNNPFADLPENSMDLLAQKAQRFLIEKIRVPEHMGITIRVAKDRGRYYVTEWRVGEQAFRGGIENTSIARISPLKGRSGKWLLAWMRRDQKWHNLPADIYSGTFDECLRIIVEDPYGVFWG